MTLDDFVLFAGNTTRSKAYLQLLVKAGFYPSLCVIYVECKDMLYENKMKTVETKRYFDEQEPLLVTLEENQIPYKVMEEKDINSAAMVEFIKSLKQKYIIYSGYGGVILKKELFFTGKRFIHIHAGQLPQYRGSTTAYYSILDNHNMSATALFLNEKIDEGEVICSETFEMPAKDVDIDYIYEPYTRAVVLTKAIKQYYELGERFITKKQETEAAETFFIIHPVLKHLAMMSLEK